MKAFLSFHTSAILCKADSVPVQLSLQGTNPLREENARDRGCALACGCRAGRSLCLERERERDREIEKSSRWFVLFGKAELESLEPEIERACEVEDFDLAEDWTPSFFHMCFLSEKSRLASVGPVTIGAGVSAEDADPEARRCCAGLEKRTFPMFHVPLCTATLAWSCWPSGRNWRR